MISFRSILSKKPEDGIPVVIENKLQEKRLPVNWDQVTFRQLLNHHSAGKDYSKVLSVFTGLDPETIRRAQIRNLDEVLTVLSFLNKPCPQRIPEKLLFYPVPKDLGFETVGQVEDLKTDLKDYDQLTEIGKLEKFPLFCAVYACKHMSKERCEQLAKDHNDDTIKFGEYHWKKAEAMKEEFFNCPAPEVLGVGNFTLLKLIGLNMSTGETYQTQITQMTRLRLVLKRWWMRLDFSLPWLQWRKKQAVNGKS